MPSYINNHIFHKIDKIILHCEKHINTIMSVIIDTVTIIMKLMKITLKASQSKNPVSENIPTINIIPKSKHNVSKSNQEIIVKYNIILYCSNFKVPQ